MSSRRRFLKRSLAAAGFVSLPKAARAQDRFDQAALLDFPTFGNVTLIHLSDVMGQMRPAYYRPSADYASIGQAATKAPYLTGEALRIRYGIGGGTPMDYALTHENFASQARAYGRMGGIAHVATVVNAIRAERAQALLLVGGAGGAQAADPSAVWDHLRPEVSAYPSVPEKSAKKSGIDNNIDFFSVNNSKIAIIRKGPGSADNRFLTSKSGKAAWDFVPKGVAHARAEGADVVVYLSQAGYSIDRQLAQDVAGLDLILSGHSHLAVPEPQVVAGTHIVASGGQGQFVSRIDLDVQNGAVQDVRTKLIPIFEQVIAAEPKVAAALARDPALSKSTAPELGRTDGGLYRRGALTSSWDRLLCDALLAQQGIDIALVPGFRWGGSLLPGMAILPRDLQSVLGHGRADVAQTQMSGAQIKALLEQAAEAAFSADPYMRNGLDMIRVGGLVFRIDPEAPMGARIDQMRRAGTGGSFDLGLRYNVASWRVLDGAPTVMDLRHLLARYVQKHGRVQPSASLVSLKV